MPYHDPVDFLFEEEVVSAKLNRQVRDNMRYMKGRALVQFGGGDLEPDQTNPAYSLTDNSGTYSAAYTEMPDGIVSRATRQWMAPPDLVGDVIPVVRVVWSSLGRGDAATFQCGLAVVTDGDDPFTVAFRTLTVNSTSHLTAGRRVTVLFDQYLGFTVSANDLLIFSLTRQGATDALGESARIHHISLEHG